MSPKEYGRMELSRREFLAILLGGSSAVTACACGGVGLTALLLSQRRGAEAVPSPLAERSLTATLPAGLSPPALIPRGDWGALEPNHQASQEEGFYSEDNPNGWRVYPAPLAAIYNTIVLHHSVIDEGDDLSTLREIQRLHREDRAWADVAYHYFVGQGGSIYEGRALNVRGTHVGGYNTGSLGLCLLGNFMESSPTLAQLASTHQMLQYLAETLQLSHLAGHREFNPGTLCPGDYLALHLPEFALRAGLRLGIEGYVPPTDAATPGAAVPGASSMPSGCCCCQV